MCVWIIAENLVSDKNVEQEEEEHVLLHLDEIKCPICSICMHLNLQFLLLIYLFILIIDLSVLYIFMNSWLNLMSFCFYY